MNTLKFGNGEWYGKKDTILAYNDENSNFKPLPFSFDRDTLATRVNKDGLIETVGSGEPRIDYKDDSKGALLLEPTRSNLITYSEDFTKSAWVKTRVSISSNVVVSPDGTLTADKIISDATLNSHFIRDDISSTIGVVSVFAKADEFTFLKLSTNAFGFQASYFDLVNGTFVEGADHIAKIENYGNGWYRCSIYVSQAFTQFYVENAGNSASATHLGDGVSGIYIWGAQAEQGSYATSYIPTQGGAVTRNQDVCNNGANEQVINSTEGVLYAEIAPLANDLTNRHIGISDDTNTNRLQIFFNTYPTTQIRTLNLVNNVKYFDMQSNVTLVNGYAKVAVKYKENDFALWINGVEAATDNSGLVWSNGVLDTLKFSDGNNASPFYGNTKDVRVYNTALTDQELQALTTI